jgi:hypothetical protein
MAMKVTRLRIEAKNTTGKMLYARRLEPKPTTFYRGRRNRPWPRAWPKFGRQLRYAISVNFLGDLTRRQAAGLGIFVFFSYRVFSFAKNKRKW